MRWSAYHIISSIRTVPYVIIAVIRDSVINMSVHMCRKHLDPIAIIVVVMRPIVRWSVPSHEIPVTRMNPWSVMSVIRADMYRSLWSFTRPHIRFAGMSSRSSIRSYRWPVSLIITLRTIRSRTGDLYRLVLISRFEVSLTARLR